MWYRLFVALSLVTVVSSSSQKMNRSILIIGSGLSGFSAARKLLENGFDDIVILEAENRIGGRIHSVPFSDGAIDLGAQWVHGRRNNLIYEMTNKHFQFGTTPFEEVYGTFVYSNGTKPDQKIFRKISEIGWKIVEEIDDSNDPEGSIGELFLKKFDIALKKSRNGLTEVDSKVIEIMKTEMHKNINTYYASKSWFDLSAKLSVEEDLAKGNQYNTWKKQGFKTFFSFLSKKLPNPIEDLNIETKVQLNKKVANINYDSDDASNVIVKCADGSSYSAKHVIFTASLGVLKKYHQNLFTPNLPQEKVAAIEAYGFGTVGKVFLEFSEPFWKEDGEPFISYSFLWLDDAKKEAKESNRDWMIDVTAFYAVDQFPNILELFVGGPKINEFEARSDQQLIDDCMWMLEKFLGKSLPKPLNMTRTKWLTNDNFLGAYSYGSIEAEKANVGVKQIASSIKNTNDAPIILFAGEATDLKFPSMAHGAVRSGFTAAKKIIEFYEK